MSRRRIRVAALAAVAALLAVAGGCGDDDGAAPPEEPPAVLDWSVVVHDDTFDLDLRLPAEPERIVQPAHLPDGTPTDLVIYTVVDDGFEVFASMLPVDPDDVDLDAVAPGAATAVEGVLLTVSRIEVDGRPGRDAEIRIEAGAGDGDGDQLLLHRAVVLDEGLLQLQTLGAETERATLERVQNTLVDGVTSG